jgi:hypothetical protein
LVDPDALQNIADIRYLFSVNKLTSENADTLTVSNLYSNFGWKKSGPTNTIYPCKK